MRIFNGKKSSMTILLPNGKPLLIKPRSFSDPLLLDVKVVENLIRSYKNTEVGILVESTHELGAVTKLSNTLTAAPAYIYQSKENLISVLGEESEDSNSEQSKSEGVASPTKEGEENLEKEKEDVKLDKDEPAQGSEDLQPSASNAQVTESEKVIDSESDLTELNESEDRKSVV